MTTSPDLPLRWHTPATWADAALAEPDALLDDHAHLERDAGANALALVRRRPEGVPSHRWVPRLAGIARDEVAHLAVVSGALDRRGGQLGRQHRNPYAAELRRHVRTGAGPRELVDRLLVSALIELRSYERFGLLAAAGHELSGLYADLRASELGHYRLFLQLARLAAPADEVEDRWTALLDVEADVAVRQSPGPRMHSGPPGSGSG